MIRDLSSGTGFAAAAQRSSLDGSTRDRGGDLGKLSADQLEKAIAKAAFSTAEGDIFGPVKNQHGWNVGQVKKIILGEPARFDAIKDQLRQQLQAEAALTKWSGGLREQIADAGVRYADEYRPADPDAPPETSPVQPGVAGQPSGDGPR